MKIETFFFIIYGMKLEIWHKKLIIFKLKHLMLPFYELNFL